VSLEGGDESIWQGRVNWDAVKASGRQFEFAKATEGHGYEDPQFARNWAEMLRVGIPIPGAYHFAREDLGNSPQAEADWFLSVVQRATGNVQGCLLALDAESAGGSARWCLAFLDRIRDRLGGYRAGFYSYASWIQSRNLRSAPRLGEYWLWLAWPDSNGPLPALSPWTGCAMQQYTAGGLTGGDINRFFGSLDQLKALTVGGGAGGPEVLDPNDQVVKDFYSGLRGIQAALNDVYNWTRPDYQRQTDITAALEGLKQAQLTFKTELDNVAAAQAGGTPADLAVLKDAVGAMDQHVEALRTHLGDAP
jgi:GH25 family lysozyme M1 (1,4-beta-N-acetylmuramidase)